MKNNPFKRLKDELELSRIEKEKQEDLHSKRLASLHLKYDSTVREILQNIKDEFHYDDYHILSFETLKWKLNHYSSGTPHGWHETNIDAVYIKLVGDLTTYEPLHFICSSDFGSSYGATQTTTGTSKDELINALIALLTEANS